jgi:hypothetical protein
VTYFVIGDAQDTNAPGNVWRTAGMWPPPHTRATRFYLHGDGVMSELRPAGATATRDFASDPRHPAPTLGGNQLTIPAGPLDQRPLEQRDDVLVFTAEACTAPVEVTGRTRARLWLRSDAPDTDCFARFCDVYPDGRSFNLCEGRRRARFRRGFDQEQLLTPGQVSALDIDLGPTSVIFNRGHRMRVSIAGTCVPGFDPNPNTGEGFRASDRARTAHNSILVDRRHPSHLLLPLAR